MTKAYLYLATLAAAVLIAGPVNAQTTQERVDARNFIAAQGVGFGVGDSVYQREGFAGGQKVKVTPIYDRTYRHNGRTISGAAVAAELHNRGGSDIVGGSSTPGP